MAQNRKVIGEVTHGAITALTSTTQSTRDAGSQPLPVDDQADQHGDDRTAPQSTQTCQVSRMHGDSAKAQTTREKRGQGLSEPPAGIEINMHFCSGKVLHVAASCSEGWRPVLTSAQSKVDIRRAISYCTVHSLHATTRALSVFCAIQRGPYSESVWDMMSHNMAARFQVIEPPQRMTKSLTALAQVQIRLTDCPVPPSRQSLCTSQIMQYIRQMALPQEWTRTDTEIIPAYEEVSVDRSQGQLDTMRCPILLTETGARYSKPKPATVPEQVIEYVWTKQEHVQALREGLLVNDRPRILRHLFSLLQQGSLERTEHRLPETALADLHPQELERLAAGWKAIDAHARHCVDIQCTDNENKEKQYGPQNSKGGPYRVNVKTSALPEDQARRASNQGSIGCTMGTGGPGQPSQVTSCPSHADWPCLDA